MRQSCQEPGGQLLRHRRLVRWQPDSCICHCQEKWCSAGGEVGTDFPNVKATASRNAFPSEVPLAPNVVLKSDFDTWWATSRAGLKAEVLKHALQDREVWAKSFLDFLDFSLANVEWIQRDSELAQSVETESEYVEVYSQKIAGRTDVSPDNLYHIKQRADDCLLAAATCTMQMVLSQLLNALVESKELLRWSQGNFGPRAYTEQFLQKYANAMLSGYAWNQPPSTFGTTLKGKRQFLECGIFFVDTGVEYPLHYHAELEAYYILSGKTRFAWLINGKLENFDREAGEWFFNPPYTPHAITTPHGTPHLSLWFREGGGGQAANDKFGPKWIGCVNGLHVVDEDGTPEADYQHPNGMIGDIGMEPGFVIRHPVQGGVRVITPSQFAYFSEKRGRLSELDKILNPETKSQLTRVLLDLQKVSRKIPHPDVQLPYRLKKAAKSVLDGFHSLCNCFEPVWSRL